MTTMQGEGEQRDWDWPGLSASGRGAEVGLFSPAVSEAEREGSVGCAGARTRPEVLNRGR